MTRTLYLTPFDENVVVDLEKTPRVVIDNPRVGGGGKS